jgi:hypothetical protein
MVRVLRRATSAEPSDRYKDAPAMARALVLAQKPEPKLVHAPGPEPVEVNRPAGQAGPVWIGAALMLVLVVTAAVIAPKLDQMAAQAKTDRPAEVDPAPVDPVQLAGNWVGTFGGERGAVLWLEGTSDTLTGRLEVPIGGGNTMQSIIEGSFDPALRQVRLRDVHRQSGSGEYIATLDEDGVLQGNFTRPMAEPVSFAFIQTLE